MGYWNFKIGDRAIIDRSTNLFKRARYVNKKRRKGKKGIEEETDYDAIEEIRNNRRQANIKNRRIVQTVLVIGLFIFVLMMLNFLGKLG